ncbi:MAG: class I SAM-dependent methyltransferase [Polaromonas sp.]|nr:class I SAM-dependent methyltransferase [Polaromonas sp.]
MSNPPPVNSDARASLKNYYDEGYHNVIHAGMIEDENYYRSRSEAFSRLYFADAERQLAVLDYGCGLGQTVAALPNAHGYDASREARDIARAHGLKTFENPSDIPREGFDIVICRHALEHVPDPLEVLTSLGSYLRPNGKLILILPKEKYYATSFEPDAHMHIYAWNFRCINNLLSLAGMRATRNDTLYNLGYRALLPLRRLIGAAGYEMATSIVGRLKNNAEFVIHAKRLG